MMHVVTMMMVVMMAMMRIRLGSGAHGQKSNCCDERSAGQFGQRRHGYSPEKVHVVSIDVLMPC
jgi:hypothetical protein